MNSKTVFCIDIDGCIMPNLFSNHGWVKGQDRNKVIEEVNLKGKDVALFPRFMEYYKMVCGDAQKIYFITGRQEKPFGDLTMINLEPLWEFGYDFTIVWYPPDRKHTSKKYFKWKATTIKTLLKGYSKTAKKYGTELNFNIYDDLPNYFPKLIKYTLRHKINCLFLKKDSNEAWRL